MTPLKCFNLPSLTARNFQSPKMDPPTESQMVDVELGKVITDGGGIDHVDAESGIVHLKNGEQYFRFDTAEYGYGFIFTANGKQSAYYTGKDRNDCLIHTRDELDNGFMKDSLIRVDCTDESDTQRI